MNSPDSGLADPLLGSGGASGTSDRSFLPQSTIYNWSCGHFSKPLLTAVDDSEEVKASKERREGKICVGAHCKMRALWFVFHFVYSTMHVLYIRAVENFMSFYFVSCWQANKSNC